jgi:CRISPR/Cas system-associated protein Csm6
MDQAVTQNTNIRTASEIMENSYQNSELASSLFIAEIVLGVLRPESKRNTLFRKVGNVSIDMALYAGKLKLFTKSTGVEGTSDSLQRPTH